MFLRKGGAGEVDMERKDRTEEMLWITAQVISALIFDRLREE